MVSQTLAKPEWNNTTVLNEGLVAAVRTIAEQESSVLVPGSPTLVPGLLRADLLDELRITLDPIVVGHGRRLFPDGATVTRLEFLNSCPLPRGVTHLVYRPVAAAERVLA